MAPRLLKTQENRILNLVKVYLLEVVDHSILVPFSFESKENLWLDIKANVDRREPLLLLVIPVLLEHINTLSQLFPEEDKAAHLVHLSELRSLLGIPWPLLEYFSCVSLSLVNQKVCMVQSERWNHLHLEPPEAEQVIPHLLLFHLQLLFRHLSQVTVPVKPFQETVFL